MTKTERIVNSVLTAQILLNNLTEIKIEPYCQKELKKFTNLLLPHLIKSEKEHYDQFFDLHEKSTDEVYQVYSNFIQQISQIPIYDCQNLLAMYQAYKIDPKSMQGITNKVLKSKKTL